ncbi:bi-domain-containing oxidoreductase [Streptomyces lividans]|uniref:Bi-domain-containing oxidoreductase n=2 Tax=Streptomyces TaxID=1883 RepID=A0ABM5RCY9_STRLI|nr:MULTISPECIES: bi-domain-containing oxidoreductase [Streptomyces]QSJ13693.1 bi-domain-containing oxidoreductase [Streptomyces lividans]AIJ18076.1 bi-domain-containing oxidoreductase [Streptomyces lividans TK24]MBQ0946903.1 bi-domain-containing oxidoreductase [Streptomyces sp. RK76]QTD74603.1 bi-domain-containing oxidoreductase [Streptomyces lividans TK24] [Streptomyces lividans]WTC06584.1 bi-domain-containing oxidoreductase [Streptomyces anthocyanicus]
MKQVVQNYKSGELALLDVPVPGCKPGGVLVRTAYSLISTGTELMKVSEAGMSMLGKARSRPDQVAKVVQSVATNGVPATYRKVMGKLDSYTPLGYSLCGVVEQVGEGIDDVKAGDLVACAGNEHALHAELNWVPRNLYAPVPDGLAARDAAFGTVGSIALQGVRQGESRLGETALVIGLGLIGQLVVQLLVASGVRVVGADPDAERCELAERLGAAACGDPASPAVESAVAELTDGHGVDQVYLAAGGGSNQPVELAARLCRDRGRVVDIGKCRLDLPWNAYYEKELDVRFSRSYGPGRYDPEYELEGRDYPIGYVRWTERRNLACFLDLVARGRVDVAPLITRTADFDDAVETYRSLQDGALKAVAVLFRYPGQPDAESPAGAPAVTVPGVRRGAGAAAPARAARTPVRLAFVGAGNYATSMLLPHLARREGVELSTVVTTTALSAANAQRKFGFGEATTDLDAVLGDASVDAVFVVTRHSSHAELTRKALLAGKAVFVEKPLALTGEELTGVLAAVEESGNDRVQVGFNRRFAPLLQEASKRFGARTGPASLRYLVNAGRLDHGSWYLQQGTEGSRFAGEGGHFVDTASWLLGADPVSVYALAPSGNEDLQVVLGYPDGSTATLSYVTTGAAGFPKETLDLVADGKVLQLDDFVRSSVYDGRKRWVSSRLPKARDKGQSAELAAFVRAVRTGGPMPVPLESLVATTAATLAVRTALAAGAPVGLAEAR